MSAPTKNAVHSMRSLPKRENSIFVVQIIDIKLIASSRYRAIISDGEYFDQSFIGGPSHHYFQSGMVQVYQLIKIKDYSITEINNGVILTLQEIEPSTCHKAIYGTPAKYEAKPTKVEVKGPAKPVVINNKENLEFTSVKTLTTNSREFSIKARVTKKYIMREWKNERGTGKLFNINIIDSFNEEISVSFFKDDAEKFYPIIQEGKVYIFRNGSVKISNKKFQTVDNEYTICADKRTEIVEANDNSDISTIKLNPISIDSLSSMQPDTLVDICAGVIEVLELTENISKSTKKPFKKRTIRLIDQSNCSIELSLWGDEATNQVFDFPRLPFPIVGKSLKLTSYNGLTLSSDRVSQIMFDCDLPQVRHLKAWLSKRTNWENPRNLSVRGSIGGEKPFKNFLEIKQECEATGKEESFTISGVVGFIRNEPDQMFYPACKNLNKCKKKVIKDSSGLYRCENCSESFEECEFRYYLNMRLQDYSDSVWAVAFDEVSSNIVGIPATELHNIYIDSQERFDDTLQKVFMKRIEGTLKVKINETPQGRKYQYILNSVQVFDANKSLQRNLKLIEELLKT